jgi:hypothetical protein
MTLVTLRSYRDPIEAELDKALLDAAGVPCVLRDEHLASIQWLYSNALGGVKLEVDDANLELAREVLKRDGASELASVPEGRLPSADGDVCPACGSSDVRPSRVHRSSAAISLGIGLPLIAWSRRWICADCGHSWRPVASTPADEPRETLEAERSVHESRLYPAFRGLFVALLGLAVLCYLEFRIRRG